MSNEERSLTISLEDTSPGYAISPERVPLSLLTSFVKDVQEFVAGSRKAGDPDSGMVEVAVHAGSLALTATRVAASSFWTDVAALRQSQNLAAIDPSRQAVIERWQARVRKVPGSRIRIAPAPRHASDTQSSIQIDASTDFRASRAERLVRVERYIRGEITDLGGSTRANAHVRLPDGKILTVRTEREKIRAEARNLVYRDVHLRVRALLDLDSGQLRDPELIEFVEYAPRFDEASFDKLIEKGRQAWADVNDPAEWTRKLRGED